MTVPLALSQTAINVTYLVAGVCLIVGIRRLSAPRTARSGNVVAAVGMAIALVFTLVDSDIDSYWLIAAGVAAGTAIGAVSARQVKMTAMPQMVALFNGVGGGAAALIAAAEYHRLAPFSGHLPGDAIGAMLFSALIGSVSFSGSLIAFGKLQDLMPGRPIVFSASGVTVRVEGRDVLRDLDFTPGVALAVKKGVKEKIVSPGSVAADSWHLVVLRDSPIKSAKDLAGRKVGITAKGSTTDFFALWAAKKGGGEIQTVPVGAGGLIPALKGRQVDAVSMHSPLPLQLIAAGEGRSIVDYGKEIGPSLPDVWVASQAIIDQRPKAIEGALRAIFKATRYLKENRAYALKYLKNFTKEVDDKVIQLEYETAIMGRTTDAAMRPEWLRASMALAEGSGLDFATIEEIYTDKFAHVKE